MDTKLDHCRATSFADNTRMMETISTKEDYKLEQNDLNKMFEWTRDNNMEFILSKFELVSYRHPKSSHLINNYKTPDGETIKQQNSVRDLGIIITDDATFTQDIVSSTGEARKQMGWILRTFKTRNPETMLTLYKSLIIPLIEYCCPLWCPTNIGQIRTIEAVQRTFTSRIDGLENTNYWERLRQLNLYSLERRRERYIIIYIWKIINGLVPNLEYSEAIRTTHNARRGVLCAIPPVAASWKKIQTLKESSIVVYEPKLFNRLPRHIRELTGTLESFKSDLDKFLTTIQTIQCFPTIT
ncbi:uncharacterized protein LOC143023512 [Oratosquilla oratoria]|uniref:uncharacterized protein LOC143023512 n=1 Tax=Oratosquilla oratoria TaxID=337810 RepID=UPI003F772768